MKKLNLSGVYTALPITYQKDSFSIDWYSYGKLVQRQIEANVEGIVLNGTTGESSTAKSSEMVHSIMYAKKIVPDRCKIIVGTGTSCTEETIEKTNMAVDAGADVILLVNPYYNKPSQRGLYLHFKAVADSTSLPVVLYNIPGRTGVNLEPETLFKLVNNTDNIIGIKEASGNLKQIRKICDLKLDNFKVLSGDDALTFHIMKEFGVSGVISVASNIVPDEMVQMVNFLLLGEFEEAKKINLRLMELFTTLLTVDSNPVPLKYAMYLMRLCRNTLRLPLVPINHKGGKIITDLLEKMKLV
ncbi:MAG: 4-hydroxy-tetrahydrodipicolinate synthase [Candidatus Paceibacterota bacterium]